MGYIAPVTHYQYIQYAERDIKKGYDPFQFVPVNKTIPIKNGGQYYLSMRREAEGKSIKVKKSSVEKIKKKTSIDKVYSELTGKGVYFNEII